MPDGSAEEIYNGPGKIVWKNCGRMQKKGQRFISLSKLQKLMDLVPKTDRIPTVS